jgi:glycerol-3-phosphate acyltransferase PlsX
MKIAVDAMGGDFAPQNIVAGVAGALQAGGPIQKLFLVGDQARVEAELRRHGPVDPRITIVHASEVIAMHDPPVKSVRRKKDSSMCRAVDLVKAGEADAVVSAGNTGALVSAAYLKLRTLQGVDRPGLACLMPTPHKPFVMLDGGANQEPTAENLVQYGLMGSLYAQRILGYANPRVALFNVGSEEMKGTDMTLEAYRQLKRSGLNFIGNVDGHDLFGSVADVIVADAFVGNAVLKACESTARLVTGMLKVELKKNPLRLLGAILAQGAFKAVKRRADPDEYGGALLLGVNGICIKAHGASSPKAIKNALRVAAEFVAGQFNEHIVEEVQKLHERLQQTPSPQSPVPTSA